MMSTNQSKFKIRKYSVVPKKQRVLPYPSDIADAEKALAEEERNPHLTRNAIVTKLVRQNLGPYSAGEEDTYKRRIIERMKIMDTERG